MMEGCQLLRLVVYERADRGRTRLHPRRRQLDPQHQLQPPRTLHPTTVDSPKHIFPRILANLIKELANKLLLLHKLDVGQGLGRQLDSLIESIVTSIRHVDDGDDDRLQTRIEHIRGRQLVLEVGGTGQDQTSHIGLVVGDKELSSELGNLQESERASGQS